MTTDSNISPANVNKASAPGSDERIKIVIKLLGFAPFHPGDTILDIGMGNGNIARSIAPRVSKVIGTGLEMASYNIDIESLKAAKIEAVECHVEKLPFPDESFDGIVMSHILEHCLNVGVALKEVRRVLKPEGLLCILVPPAEPIVRGGHVSVGWNIGQLIYVLTMAGFDAEKGNFVKKGYNVCAFVRKDARPLPRLRHDFGDLRTLGASGRLPLPIQNEDPNNESFLGDLLAVNWPWIEVLDVPQIADISSKAKIVRSFVPKTWRPRLSSLFRRFANALGDPKANQQKLSHVNPAKLQES